MKSFLQNANTKDIETELVRYLQYDPSLAAYKNVLKKLIPLKCKEILKQALLENSRRGNFIRIYPSKGTDVYDKYFKSVRPYNVFLYKCLYSDEILPMNLTDTLGQMPSSISTQAHNITRTVDESRTSITNYKSKTKKQQRPQTVKVSSHPSMKAQESDEKIIITGDDVLIEYVQRVINTLTVLAESELAPEFKLAIDKFILHYVWHSEDPSKKNPTASLRERLQARYEEMLQRRKRLVRSIYKREGKLEVFEASYKKMTQQKMAVLNNFDGKKLEDMLKTSTKNVAQEVVSILLNHSRERN